MSLITQEIMRLEQYKIYIYTIDMSQRDTIQNQLTHTLRRNDNQGQPASPLSDPVTLVRMNFWVKSVGNAEEVSEET